MIVLSMGDTKSFASTVSVTSGDVRITVKVTEIRIGVTISGLHFSILSYVHKSHIHIKSQEWKQH